MSKYQTVIAYYTVNCPLCGGCAPRTGAAPTLTTPVGADRSVEMFRCVNGHAFQLASVEV